MTRKILATAVAAGLFAGQTVAATAAPVAERNAAPVEDAEAAGISTLWLVALFIAIGVGIIFLVEDSENDVPASP